MTPGKIRDRLEKAKADLYEIEYVLNDPPNDWPFCVASTVIVRHEVAEALDDVGRALEALDEAGGNH